MIVTQDLSIEIAKKTLVSNLSIKFNSGEFWSIIGKNGTGKTSLLNNLAGFNDYEQGSITIDNQEIDGLDSLTRAQKISFLPQLLETGLDCTVKQSIAFGRYPWHKHASKKKQERQITNQVIAKMQLESIQDKSIQKISGGELRKVELATVLAQDSKIMMLDEPLNHLDIAMRYHLMEHLKTLNENKIIIIVTHDIQYVQQYCTHVLMLQDGAKVKFGSVTEMMTEENLYENLGIPFKKY